MDKHLTTPQPPGLPGASQPPVIDTGNALLTQTPAQLMTGQIMTPVGQLGVLTIRTTSTTLTIMLDGKNLKEWAGILNQLASSMSGNGLVTGSAGTLGHIRPQ
jgi:hypothetical protein